jgi:S-DNA-T family DNA segregation ATPase FtsK/SpoIIIE
VSMPEPEEANPYEAALWAALRAAPEQGSDIAELMRVTGMGRSTIYRYLGQLADEGRAIQTGWGHWRAATAGEEDHDE